MRSMRVMPYAFRGARCTSMYQIIKPGSYIISIPVYQAHAAGGMLTPPWCLRTIASTEENSISADIRVNPQPRGEAELRWASMLAKITEQNYQVGQPREVYNAATLGACTFLGRDDLGRLARGAKADILLINLDHLGSAFYADPIKALVDFGCGRDVDTVIVDGKTLVQGGDVVHLDEAEVYASAQQATQRFWSQIPTWHWGGCNLEEIVPPAFPMHRTAVAAS